MVDLLLDLHAAGKTPLEAAVQTDHDGIVRRLLENNI